MQKVLPKLVIRDIRTSSFVALSHQNFNSVLLPELLENIGEFLEDRNRKFFILFLRSKSLIKLQLSQKTFQESETVTPKNCEHRKFSVLTNT